MNTNDFLTKVEGIKLPELDIVPYMVLSNNEIAEFGLDKNTSTTVYLFNTGELLELKTHDEASKLIYDDKYVKLNPFDATSCNSPLDIRYFTYFNYIESMEVVGIYLLAINTRKIKLGEIRKFDIINHYYITKDRAFVYQKDGKWVAEYDINKAKTELPFSYRNEQIQNSYKVAFTNLFGLSYVRGEYCFSDTSSNLANFFIKKKDDEEKITKKLAKIAEKHMGKELSVLDYKPDPKLHRNAIAKLEYVDKETSVIRWFKHGSNGVNYEYMRFYVTDDANFLCALKNDGKLHVVTKNIDKDAMTISELLMDKEELKDSKFKYFFDMIENFPSRRQAVALYETFRFDLIEKFSKSGMPTITNDALSVYFNSRILPYTTIGKLFDVKISPKETDIYKALKVNKYQYKKLAPLANDSTYYNVENSNCAALTRSMRLLFGHASDTPLNDIDNATFDKYFAILCEIFKNANYYKNVPEKFIDATKNIYSLDAIYNGLCALKVLFVSGNSSAARVLIDYANMVKKINDKKSFPMKFTLDDVEVLKSEIKNAHDGAVEVYNLMREQYRAENFAEQIKKCDKWVYDNEEEKLLVIAPTKAADLAKEGLELHHCVKSYIDKVAEGKTNIMFIRKKSEPDKPFFTVEISNKGVIEQVHGFANRNINTEPDLENFILRWAKTSKLKISNIDKIR